MDKRNEYQGHKNWTHWNVSLWIFNDESTYRLAVEMVKSSKSRAVAATKMQQRLPAKTPDGARYSHIAIMAALADIDN